jgi:hypothetical protein
VNRKLAAFLLLAIAAPAAHVLGSARLTAVPAPGTSLRAGELTNLRFEVAGEEADVDEMEVLLSLDGGKTFSLRVTKEMSAGTHELWWRVPNLPTTAARIALRVGGEEGEVIRDVSGEFTIVGDATEPLEEVRPFRGEWRAGEALEEMPSRDPIDAPLFGGTGDSIRALRPEMDLDRTTVAAPAGAPPTRRPEKLHPISTARLASSPPAPLLLNVPLRQ